MDHKTACRREGKKCWGGGSTEEGEKKGRKEKKMEGKEKIGTGGGKKFGCLSRIKGKKKG